MNSGLLYGSARPSSPPRTYVAPPVDAARYARSQAIEVVNTCIPALRECLNERQSSLASEIIQRAQQALGQMVLVLQYVAYGRRVDRNRLWGAYSSLEQACDACGIRLAQPGSFAGRIGAKLRGGLDAIDRCL